MPIDEQKTSRRWPSTQVDGGIPVARSITTINFDDAAAIRSERAAYALKIIRDHNRAAAKEMACSVACVAGLMAFSLVCVSIGYCLGASFPHLFY